MAADSLIEVLLEVPPAVTKGLASGDMIRRGGVIQWATGEAKGKVVMWLKESGSLARIGAEVPAQVTQQLANLQTATNILALGQAVTLGFSVLSFTVLNHKLNVLNRKVDQILAEIADLKEEAVWLNRRQDLALEARLRRALDQCQWAVVNGRIEALVAERGTLVEVEHHYRGLLAAMLDQQRAHQHAAVFAAYQGHLVLAGVARVRCEAVLDGFERGLEALQTVQSVVNEAEQAFRRPLRNLDQNLYLLRLGVGAERLLRPALGSMTETVNRLEGYRTEFDYCSRQGITLGEWDELGGDDAEPRLLLLVPKKAAAGDSAFPHNTGARAPAGSGVESGRTSQRSAGRA